MQDKERGALQAPKDFKRTTGAHEILASLAVAEVLNMLAMLFLGAWVSPIAWWCLKYIGRWFHGSLLFDLGLLLFLGFLLRGFTRQYQLKKIGMVSGPTADVWNIPCGFMALIAFLLILLRVVPWGWMDIPLGVIPTYPLEHFPWPMHPFVPGAWIAAALLFLTHLRILQRSRQQRVGLAYSRAHPGSNRTRLIQQAYGFYERGLARFDPPPVQLKTPASFLYFESDRLPELLEKGVYWINGESLVISDALLGPSAEQAAMLLPLLSRLLHDSNSLTLTVERVFKLVKLAEQRFHTQLLLIITLLVADYAARRWEKLERDRVEDRDRFAYWCGEGPRLRKLLMEQRELLRDKKLPDNAIPPLHERIDHLEGLIKQEARQVDKLKGSLPPVSPTH
jgi:hypothetical protein